MDEHEESGHEKLWGWFGRKCNGKYWQARRPPQPSFWKRLGDAIIERVKGKL